MDNIQKQAINLYNKNLLFLKNYDHSLYNRIVMLDELINTQQYKERYHLEYIKEEKDFDILDTQTGTYIYNRKPSKFIQEALNNTNCDKDNSFDLLNPNVYNYRHPISIDKNEPLSRREQFLYVNDIFEFTNIFKMSTVYKKKKFKYIEKFVFAGTLLGTHILPIHNKLKCSFYLIYEYNLEIFRLSLFTTDYSSIATDSKIIFSIMEDKLKAEEKISALFHHAIKANYMVKYYCTNYNIHDLFDRILAVASHKTPLAYNYTKIIEGLYKPFFKNIKKYPILNTIKKHTLLNNKKILFIAAGPSLDKNIDWLIENQNNYVIITIGAAVARLIEHNILPDIIVTADADEIIENQFPKKIRDKIKNIPLIASAITYSKVLECFNSDNVVLFEVIGQFKSTSHNVYGYSVGEMTLNICSVLGAEEIYLLGTDLALDQETGDSHISGHQTSVKKEISEKELKLNAFMDNGTYSLGTSTLLVKGNFTDKVLTTILLEKSITSYSKTIDIIFKKNKNIKIYNLSDGAYINRTIPLKITEIQNQNNTKKISSNIIKDYLNNSSQFGFTHQELKKLQESLSVLEKLLDKVQDIENKQTSTYNEFVLQQYQLLGIIANDLAYFSSFLLDRIFINYMLTIEPYLGYHFNDEDIDESKYLDDIKKIWIKQFRRIALEYKEIISNGIKKENPS
jgi:hypothetical protein